MKHLLLFAFALLAFVSCKDAEEFSSQPVAAQQPLENVLKIYNDSTMASKTIETRASSSVSRFLSIAIADAVGAYRYAKYGARIGALLGPKGATAGAIIGGVAGGAGYSYVEYNKRKSTRVTVDSVNMLSFRDFGTAGILGNHSTDNPFNDPYSQFLNRNRLKFPPRFRNCERVGWEHNYVLNAYSEEGVRLNCIPMDSLSEEEQLVMQSDELNQCFMSDVEKIANGEMDFLHMGDEKSDRVMSLFLELYNSYPENEADIVTIINDYAAMIADSDEITDEEKEQILGGLSVALYSYQYWIENLEQNKKQ